MKTLYRNTLTAAFILAFVGCAEDTQPGEDAGQADASAVDSYSGTDETDSSDATEGTEAIGSTEATERTERTESTESGDATEPDAPTTDPAVGTDDLDPPDDEPSCWLPEPAVDGGLDCPTFCGQMEDVCGADAGSSCPSGCATANAMFAPNAAATVQGCIAEAECGYSKAEHVFVACMVEEKLGAEGTHAETCAAISAGLDDCPADDEISSLPTICEPMMALFTEEARGQLAKCADVGGCEATRECLLLANCFVPLFLDGAEEL